MDDRLKNTTRYALSLSATSKIETCEEKGLKMLSVYLVQKSDLEKMKGCFEAYFSKINLIKSQIKKRYSDRSVLFFAIKSRWGLEKSQYADFLKKNKKGKNKNMINSLVAVNDEVENKIIAIYIKKQILKRRVAFFEYFDSMKEENKDIEAEVENINIARKEVDRLENYLYKGAESTVITKRRGEEGDNSPKKKSKSRSKKRGKKKAAKEDFYSGDDVPYISCMPTSELFRVLIKKAAGIKSADSIPETNLVLLEINMEHARLFKK